MAKGMAVPHTDAQYQAEEDCRTMERYAEVKSNPKRMGAAMNVVKKKMSAMHGIISMGKGKKGRGKNGGIKFSQG